MLETPAVTWFSMVVMMTLFALYLVPWIWATAKQHENSGLICTINVLFGWTVLGWVFALALACGKPFKLGLANRLKRATEQTKP